MRTCATAAETVLAIISGGLGTAARTITAAASTTDTPISGSASGETLLKAENITHLSRAAVTRTDGSVESAAFAARAAAAGTTPKLIVRRAAAVTTLAGFARAAQFNVLYRRATAARTAFGRCIRTAATATAKRTIQFRRPPRTPSPCLHRC